MADPDAPARRRLRWGVLGAANIARRAVAPAIQASRNGTLVAVASRDLDRAEAMAAQLSAARAYDSYAALLDDPDVDAVYIPLPNHLHRPWTEQAAAAGKHVLCEKPLALDADEAQAMVEACARHGVVLMEAFMYRFHPRIRAVRRLVGEGRIGALRLVRAAFSFAITRRPNIRLDPAMGGGALMDVGCYGVSFARYVVGEEPAEVFAYAGWGAESGVDETLAALLRFSGGAIALVDCSFEAARRMSAEVVGSEGRIEVPTTWLPGTSDARLLLERGDRPAETITIPGADQYQVMVEEFAEAVIAAAPAPLPPTDAVANMRVLDALRR